MSLFSTNLRYLRKSRRLNQEDIARLFDKRPNTIGYWENGKSEPGLAELTKLGEFFNINIHELLHRDMQTDKPTFSAGKILHIMETPVAKPVDGPINSLTNDTMGAAISSILLELKTVHEKLDKISIALSAAVVRNATDKSNH